MDTDPVRIFLVLESNRWTWTPVTDRWLARNAMRDFAEGVPWDGERVVRALIVEVPE